LNWEEALAAYQASYKGEKGEVMFDRQEIEERIKRAHEGIATDAVEMVRDELKDALQDIIIAFKESCDELAGQYAKDLTACLEEIDRLAAVPVDEPKITIGGLEGVDPASREGEILATCQYFLMQLIQARRAYGAMVEMNLEKNERIQRLTDACDTALEREAKQTQSKHCSFCREPAENSVADGSNQPQTTKQSL
jgi:hypothetical protein